MSHYDNGVNLLFQIAVDASREKSWHEQITLPELQRQEELDRFFRVVRYKIGQYLLEEEKKTR